MFHWICPECGCEIPPSVKECPACDPKSVAVAAQVPVAAAPVIPAPEPETGKNPSIVSTAVTSSTPARPASLVPPPDPAPEIPIDPLLVMAEQIRSVQMGYDAPSVSLPSALVAQQANEEPKPAPPEVAAQAIEEPLPPAQVPPPSEAAVEAPPSLEPQPLAAAIQETIEKTVPPEGPVEAAVPEQEKVVEPPPEPPDEPKPLELTAAESKTPEPAVLEQIAPELIAIEPAVPENIAPDPPTPEPPAPESPAPQIASPGLGELAAAIGLTPAQPVTDVPTDLEAESAAQSDREFAAEMDAIPADPDPAPAIEQNPTMHDASVTLALLTPPLAERSRTPLLLPAGPAHEKFSPEPVAAQPNHPPLSESLLIEGPPSGPHLPLAPLQDYSAAASRAIRPAGEKAKVLASDAGPKITLPGPALPPDLTSFKDANLVAVRSHERRTKTSDSLPGWLVSMMVMMLLLTVGITVVFYALPLTRSNSAPKAAPTEAQASVTQGNSFPLAQYIEVTGFRIVVDFTKKSEIHYLVVNHSAAALSDLTVYVTLQSAKASPGQAPVCRFSFRSPELGPFESKEMTSSIEKLSRSVTVPEWNDLRAEVQVSQ